MHVTLTGGSGGCPMLPMRNPSIAPTFAPSPLAVLMAAMRRIVSGGVAPPAPRAGKEGAGGPAFTDGFPLSTCPYAREAQVDRWRSGWLDAQRRRDGW